MVGDPLPDLFPWCEILSVDHRQEAIWTPEHPRGVSWALHRSAKQGPYMIVGLAAQRSTDSRSGLPLDRGDTGHDERAPDPFIHQYQDTIPHRHPRMDRFASRASTQIRVRSGR